MPYRLVQLTQHMATLVPTVIAGPTVTINKGAAQSDPTVDTTITFDVVFSESVSGFATGDVTLSGTAGATTGTVAGSGATYTVSVTGMTTQGTVIASIAAGVCTSVATGLPNVASTSTDNNVTWSPSLATMIAALSPVGYWKLDEGAGTTATDSSGNGRNGTYTGTGYTLQGATGPTGNFVDLGNAASSHIAIADNNAWSANTASGLTIFALCKPDAVGGANFLNIASKGAASNFEWAFGINTGSTAKLLLFTWNAAGVTCRSVTSNNAIMTASAWQAVVAVTESPTTSCNQSLYRNSSSAEASTLATSSGTPYANGTAQLWIGWRADSPANQYWGGGMAHVAIFAGQLNTTQIGTLMTAADAEGWY